MFKIDLLVVRISQKDQNHQNKILKKKKFLTKRKKKPKKDLVIIARFKEKNQKKNQLFFNHPLNKIQYLKHHNPKLLIQFLQKLITFLTRKMVIKMKIQSRLMLKKKMKKVNQNLKMNIKNTRNYKRN